MARGRAKASDIPGLLTLRAYARHRGQQGLPGHALSSVQAAIAAGRIPTIERAGRTWIDPVVADAAWVEGTRPAIGQTGPDESPATALPKGNGGGYASARSELEGVKLEQARLDLAERLGTLCKVAEVQEEAEAAGRRMRDMILGIPARVAAILRAELGGEITERQVETVLQRELRALLVEAAGRERARRA